MKRGRHDPGWTVAVDGTPLFIAAATSLQTTPLNEEIQQVVESIRFG